MISAALLHPRISSEEVERFRSETCSVKILEELTGARQLDTALIFGGDGTVHRYLPELCRRKTPVLVVPKGSGNDFAKSLGIQDEATALRAWKLFCESGGANVMDIDLGVVRSAGTEVPFCCVAGVGLDSMANATANRMPAWLRGTAGYLLAALQAVFAFRTAEFSIVTPKRRIAGPGLLVAVGNAHRYGHGMKIAPRAELSDGMLDVCFVGTMNRLKLLCCVPTIFFGAHLGIEQVQYVKSASLRIEADRQLDIYADGEFAGRTPAEIGIWPRAFRVIVPEGHSDFARKVP